MGVPALIKQFLASTTAKIARAALNITDDVAYTPTFTGFGTPTNVSFFWSRVGNRIKGMGKFTSGIATGVEARLSLPGSLISDSTLIPSIMSCGKFVTNNNSANVYGLLIESGVGYITFAYGSGVTAGLTKQNANNFASSGQIFSLEFELPVAG